MLLCVTNYRVDAAVVVGARVVLAGALRAGQSACRPAQHSSLFCCRWSSASLRPAVPSARRNLHHCKSEAATAWKKTTLRSRNSFEMVQYRAPAKRGHCTPAPARPQNPPPQLSCAYGSPPTTSPRTTTQAFTCSTKRTPVRPTPCASSKMIARGAQKEQGRRKMLACTTSGTWRAQRDHRTWRSAE